MIEDVLLSRIKRFCRSLEISPTQFGLKSINDPNLISDLENGRELRAGTRGRVEKYLDKFDKKSPKAS